MIELGARLEKPTAYSRATGKAPPPAPGAKAESALSGLNNFHLFAAVAILLLASNAIFATALQPAPAALVLVGCATLGALILRMPHATCTLFRASVDWRVYAACGACGAALCILGGQAHFLYSTTDWLVRDAVLHDVVASGFNIVYRYGEQDYLLRAPLGLFTIPAVAGRAFGVYAAHLVMLAQNAFILSTIVYFLVSLAQARKAPMLLLFFLFSGMDIVGVMVAEAVSLSRGGEFMSFNHIEWWLNFFTSARLQFSSHITQLFWAPNHMIPGWLFGMLALLYVRKEVDLAVLLGSFTLLLLWSPLAMIGALPFIALFALERGFEVLSGRRVWLAAIGGLCFLPVAIYLTTDAGQVPHGWLIGQDFFALIYIAVVAIELPQIAIVLAGWRLLEPGDRRLMGVAIASLLAFPLYSFGPYNDLSMRGSIAPLFLLAFAFARVAVLTPRDNGRFATAIGVVVILSFATPMLEIQDAFNPRYAISDCNLLTAWHKTYRSQLPTNYWSRVEKTPSWLITPGAAAPLTLEDRKCWPDHPLLGDAMK